jgi:hypothetical protein
MNNNENIFFSIDDVNDFNSGVVDCDLVMNDITNLFNKSNNFDCVNQMNNLLDEDMFEAMCYEYKINYTVKELLLICDYYGISKEMKSNKYNKEEIINVLVQFENNPINNDIFLRRQKMWYFIDKLKNDKFMKKYILWN